MEQVTPEYILNLRKPPEGNTLQFFSLTFLFLCKNTVLNKINLDFLCEQTANVYGIEFLSYIIKDYQTKETLFHITKDVEPEMGTVELDFDAMEDCTRKIKYTFSSEILTLPYIETW